MHKTLRPTILAAGLLIAPLAGNAMDISPDLFVDGSCDDIVTWASQPVDTLKADLDERLGTEYGGMMKGSTGRTILDMVHDMPVANNWFESQCTFSDAQLALMENLHAAYVQHLEGVMTE